jgi:nuclear pore complex protein Nup62
VDTPKPSFTATATPDGVPAASTPAPAGAAATASSTPREPVSFEYQTLTVEQILNKFQQQLEEDALAFVQEARRVCEYDAALRDSQRDLAKLTTEAQRLMLEQEQIEQNIAGIDAFQNEIDRALNQVEKQVDQIFQHQSHLAPQDADTQRDSAYETAKNIDRRLEDVMESLKATTEQLHNSNEHCFVGETRQIFVTLNQHQDKLVDLEAEAGKLEMDCSELTRQIQRSVH